MFDSNLYRELRELPASAAHKQIVSGYSGAEVYHFPELKAYLKIAKHGSFSDLRREAEVLMWLEGRLRVPKVLRFESDEANAYLLTSEIEGTPAFECLAPGDLTSESATRLLQKMARALRRMHDIDIIDCPLEQRLDAKFARAWKNIEGRLLSETDAEFALEHDGKLPKEVYRELSRQRPNEEELVFTHGDPCMPNIIIRDDEISGFIDMDCAGVADRYADIAIFFGSFRRNFQVAIELEQIFCEAYGLVGLDRRKLEFYTTLDDLF